jgi:AraC-like DNA-binding protein
MTLITRFPVSPLDMYIDRVFYRRGPMPYAREKIIPAACLDLKINLGSPIRTYAADQPNDVSVCTESWSVGLWNTTHIVEWPDSLEFYGVFFKVGGAYPFLRIPASELHNQVISLDSLWGNFADEIRDRLSAAPSVDAGLAILEQALRDNLREVPRGLKIVHYALAEIARHQGTISIQALSDDIGISQNYLGQLFKTMVGGTPKEIARLYRFQQVLDCANAAQPLDWTSIAHQVLFYDQSHFNKEFAAFTSYTPTEYLRLRRRVQDENPQHAYYLRQLPLD